MRPTTYRMPAKAGTYHFYPLSCIHWPVGRKGLLERWVKTVKEDPNAVALLMGDVLDLARTRFRNHVRGYTADRNSQEGFDDYSSQLVEEVGNILMPVREKLIGNICGNHYWEDVQGVNSEQRIADFLDIPYLGPFGVARIDFVTATTANKSGSKARGNVTIVAHHKSSSGVASTVGSEANRLEKFGKKWDANIICLGHTHRAAVFENDAVWGISTKGSPTPFLKPKLLMACGTLMDGINLEGEIAKKNRHLPHYAEEAGLTPMVAGWPVANITIKRNDAGTMDIGITGHVIR